MLTKLVIAEDATSHAADHRTLIDNLVAFNHLHAEPEHHLPIAIFAKEPSQTLVGGVRGYTHWRWLFISHLWIDERARGLGLGRSLIEQIERVARKRGCLNAHCDTFSFQSLGFYEHLGYTRFAQLEEYPPGQIRYFLSRDLGQIVYDERESQGS